VYGEVGAKNMPRMIKSRFNGNGMQWQFQREGNSTEIAIAIEMAI